MFSIKYPVSMSLFCFSHSFVYLLYFCPSCPSFVYYTSDPDKSKINKQGCGLARKGHGFGVKDPLRCKFKDYFRKANGLFSNKNVVALLKEQPFVPEAITFYIISGVARVYPVPDGQKYFCAPINKNCRVWRRIRRILFLFDNNKACVNAMESYTYWNFCNNIRGMTTTTTLGVDKGVGRKFFRERGSNGRRPKNSTIKPLPGVGQRKKHRKIAKNTKK